MGLLVRAAVGLHDEPLIRWVLVPRNASATGRPAACPGGADAARIGSGRAPKPWAPGYYYVLFEDPDGIRLEVNFVPGAGLLADGAQFNPDTGYA
jgi:hypothetical protein